MNNIDLEIIIKQLINEYFPLTEECISDLKEFTKVKMIKRSNLLIKEGQHTDKIYYIISGSARAYYLKNGKEISDWFAFENDFITSINGFFLSIPSPYNVEILESSTLIEFSKENLNLLSTKHHDFTQFEKAIVTKTMLQLQERIVSLQFETAQQKFDNLLKIYPNITQRISSTHIASYLGITLETLSRIRNSKGRS